ncbi:hypothetical protein MTO96_000827 [Rhipicephalus appendiculatus]
MLVRWSLSFGSDADSGQPGIELCLRVVGAKGLDEVTIVDGTKGPQQPPEGQQAELARRALREQPGRQKQEPYRLILDRKQSFVMEEASGEGEARATVSVAAAAPIPAAQEDR